MRSLRSSWQLVCCNFLGTKGHEETRIRHGCFVCPMTRVECRTMCPQLLLDWCNCRVSRRALFRSAKKYTQYAKYVKYTKTMHIGHILHILQIRIIKIPDVVWGCHVCQFYSCPTEVEATWGKHMMHSDILTETELSYQAERTEQRIDRICQCFHELLFPIWMLGDPGCDFRHQPECVSGISEPWRWSKCWCEYQQSLR